MNEITIFENPEFGSVRTITIDGEPSILKFLFRPKTHK